MTLVLGIESSCDETAAAVVRDGREVLSSAIHSQAAQHAVYGGVVPELAGRSHLRQILPVLDEALASAKLELDQIDAIAVTARPGLVGSLLVGLSTAKALAFARNLPLIGVHHIQAHVYAATMELAASDPTFDVTEALLPALALVVSGGHTSLYEVRDWTDLVELGTTLDDAAGEAFDKVAWLLGLEYPGGPSISKLAGQGNPKAVAFPRYNPPKGQIGFSFSGLKTSVLYHLRGGDALAPTPAPEDIGNRADVAASFQEAVVDALVKQSLRAARGRGLETLLVAGGVACNARLRERMTAAGEDMGLRVLFPSPAYCTDNAVMIAGLGYQLFRAGRIDDLQLDASPR